MLKRKRERESDDARDRPPLLPFLPDPPVASVKDRYIVMQCETTTMPKLSTRSEWTSNGYNSDENSEGTMSPKPLTSYRTHTSEHKLGILPIVVNKSRSVKLLENVWNSISRAGTFYTRGEFVVMSKIAAADIGIVAFPVLQHQIDQLIRKATQGEKTIVETSVRKVWQLAAENIEVSGAAWQACLGKILAKIKVDFSCENVEIKAELYNMSIYEEGATSLSHRDTAKVPGMFATLVFALPSHHVGGELEIRHLNKQVSVDLSGADVSEIKYVAFYADCEHELKPVREGNRVCLVYNLIQVQQQQQQSVAPLKPASYDFEIEAISHLLLDILTRSHKIVWALDHEYNPSHLSFAQLKGSDAFRASAFLQASIKAKCSIYLGMIHIKESGAAEIEYSKDRYQEDPYRNIMEAYGWNIYIDSWIDSQNQPTPFRKMPVSDGELCPEGVLEGEAPDKVSFDDDIRSYERSYRRAALIIWKQDVYTELKARRNISLGSAFAELISKEDWVNSIEKKHELSQLATQIINNWESDHSQSTKFGTLDEEVRSRNRVSKSTPSGRSRMLGALITFGDLEFLKSFITNVVADFYDGRENKQLIEAFQSLDDDFLAPVMIPLIQSNFKRYPDSCIGLLIHLKERPVIINPVIGSIVETLPKLSYKCNRSKMLRVLKIFGNMDMLKSFISKVVVQWYDGSENEALFEAFQSLDDVFVAQVVRKLITQHPTQCLGLLNLLKERSAIINPVLKTVMHNFSKFSYDNRGSRCRAMVDLWKLLKLTNEDELLKPASAQIISSPAPFDPITVVLPALTQIAGACAEDSEHSAFVDLWEHCAKSVLARSEFAPGKPGDWRHHTTISCKCGDCQQLQAFLLARDQQVGSFRLAKQRRQHIHRMIESSRAALTHITQAPNTLVCTKIRKEYDDIAKTHSSDIELMKTLLSLSKASSSPTLDRLRLAISRE